MIGKYRTKATGWITIEVELDDGGIQQHTRPATHPEHLEAELERDYGAGTLQKVHRGRYRWRLRHG